MLLYSPTPLAPTVPPRRAWEAAALPRCRVLPMYVRLAPQLRPPSLSSLPTARPAGTVRCAVGLSREYNNIRPPLHLAPPRASPWGQRDAPSYGARLASATLDRAASGRRPLHSGTVSRIHSHFTPTLFLTGASSPLVTRVIRPSPARLAHAILDRAPSGRSPLCCGVVPRIY